MIIVATSDAFVRTAASAANKAAQVVVKMMANAVLEVINGDYTIILPPRCIRPSPTTVGVALDGYI